MLRIRSLEGVVRQLEEDERFVEIADLDGKLALLIYEREDGSIVMLNNKDKKFADYVGLYGLESSAVKDLGEEKDK
jgi:hypothetical protein